MIKSAQETKSRRNFLNLIKVIYRNTVYVIFNCERLDPSFIRSVTIQRYALLALLLIILLEMLASEISQENEVKVIKIRREIFKLFLHNCHDLVYRKS